MSAPPFTKALSSPLVPIGVVFFALNAWASYAFYQINSYKLLIALVGALVLVAGYEGFARKKVRPIAPKGLYMTLLVPTLAAMPGAVASGFEVNYNFAYELATNLILWLWAVYLFQTLYQPGRHQAWAGWLGLTLVFSGSYALGEFAGLWGGGSALSGLVKATFGHRNYFASYLAQMAPLFFALSLPLPGLPQERRRRLWAGLALLALVALVLTQTRAAIAAGFLSLFLVAAGYAWFLLERAQGRKLLVGLGALAGAGLVSLLVYGLGVSADPTAGNRFEQLFSKRAWIGRLIPWETAWQAFMDAPLFGHGLGSSYNLFFEYVDPATRMYHHERSYNHAHSEWLEYLAEAGLLGWVAFVLLVWFVYKAMRRVFISGDLEAKRLALGFGGGFVAFEAHGAFSVAPRMVVAELPWALGLAALFALAAQFAEVEPLAPRHKRSLAMLNLGLLTLAAALLFPWLAQQNAFRRLMNQPKTDATARQLEALAASSSDIYTQEHLLQLQQRLGRLEPMRKTFERIEQLIPHYRETDYHKAVWALMLKQPEQARRLAQQAQLKDRYHLPNIRLLLNLALENNNFEGFAYQVELLLRRHLVRNFVVVAFKEDQVPIERKANPYGLEFREEGSRLRLRLDPHWLKNLFDQARTYRSQRPGSLEQEQTLSRLAREIAQNPYFRLQVRPEYLAQEAQVFELLGQYQQANRQWASRQSYLKFSRNQDLKEAQSAAERRKIDQVHRQRLQSAQAEARVEMRRLEAQLQQKSDFNHFLTKHRFAAQWLREIKGMYFP